MAIIPGQEVSMRGMAIIPGQEVSMRGGVGGSMVAGPAIMASNAAYGGAGYAASAAGAGGGGTISYGGAGTGYGGIAPAGASYSANAQGCCGTSYGAAKNNAFANGAYSTTGPVMVNPNATGYLTGLLVPGGAGGETSGGGACGPSPDGTGCGCGPGASAGESAGAAYGAETMCCEPEGALTGVQWVQVTGGAYSPQMSLSYAYVGEGSGTYEKKVTTTYYGWRVRKCCIGLCCLLLLLPLLYLLLSMVGWEPRIEVDPKLHKREVIKVVKVVIDPPFPTTTDPRPTPMPTTTTTKPHKGPNRKIGDPRPSPAPTPVPVGPPRTCLIFGDPHALTFDGERSDYYTPGEYWIVKSDTVWIQGKYQPTRLTNGLSVTKQVGIGGAFMKGHKLVVGVDFISWDGAVVQQGFEELGAHWYNEDPAISIEYNGQGTIMQESREGKALHVVHLHLPNRVTIEANRWSDEHEGSYINLRIIMPEQPNQDGHCGNFDGNAANDKRVAVRERVGTNGVPEEDLIFPGPKTAIKVSGRPDLNDCPEGELKIAMERCKAAEKKFFPSNACLIDTCLGHLAPKP